MNRRAEALIVVMGGPGDTTAPTVTITSTESSPTTAKPVPITITFSEAVAGFEVGDITAALSGGTVTLSSFAGSGTTYTVDATPSLSNGTMTFDVAEGVAEDAAGNTNTTATQFVMVFDNRIVWDTFTGTDATSLPSHTPNTDLVGGGWQLTTGSAIAITSNRAKGTAFSNGYPGNVAWIETNVSDCVITGVLRFTTTGANTVVGFVVRFVDTDNTLIVMIEDAANLFRIRKREGATNTDLATVGVTINVETDYAISITLSGNTITATLDGANQISAETEFNNTATKHGLQLRTNEQITDDFVVVGNF